MVSPVDVLKSLRAFKGRLNLGSGKVGVLQDNRKPSCQVDLFGFALKDKRVFLLAKGQS